jgi:lipoprotein-anchoring transpeptidase ErfK/SrfK
VAETPVSSGRKGFETPAGKYQVVQKDEKHVSNLYGDYLDEAGGVLKKNADTSREPTPEGASFKGASMPYFLRFEGGYGLHAGSLPGRAASHGCVRLPRAMARRFFENVAVGTPVIIQ